MTEVADDLSQGKPLNLFVIQAVALMSVSQVKIDTMVTTIQCFISSVVVKYMHRDCQVKSSSSCLEILALRKDWTLVQEVRGYHLISKNI